MMRSTWREKTTAGLEVEKDDDDTPERGKKRDGNVMGKREKANGGQDNSNNQRMRRD